MVLPLHLSGHNTKSIFWRNYNGGSTIFEWSKYHSKMVIVPFLEKLEVRMVVEPYMSSHNIIIVWS
jgi:hypothetical protein